MDVIVAGHVVQVRHFSEVVALLFLLVEVLADGLPALHHEERGLSALWALLLGDGGRGLQGRAGQSGVSAILGI